MLYIREQDFINFNSLLEVARCDFFYGTLFFLLSMAVLVTSVT